MPSSFASMEELQARVRLLEKMDSEAATHVESLICMKSAHFTGEPPYVGWKGLGLALKQDYEEMDRMRKELNARRPIDAMSCGMSPVEAAIWHVWGDRCSDFDSGCLTCQAWAEFDGI